MNRFHDEVIEQLEALRDPGHAKSLSRYAIPDHAALGIRIPVLRSLAKDLGKNQELADQLWRHDYHEAKLLAVFISEPAKFSVDKAGHWVQSLYSWDICDQLCSNVLVHTSFAEDLPHFLIPDRAEFVRRAGIVQVATMAVHHKGKADSEFLKYLPLLKMASKDPRNFVKKAVSWSLRQLGKRSAYLHGEILKFSHQLALESGSAEKWIAKDVLRELESASIRNKWK